MVLHVLLPYDVVLHVLLISDAAEFTKLCRDALESPHVSMNLHHWIDLIFGFKQQGQPAEEADNSEYGIL